MPKKLIDSTCKEMGLCQIGLSQLGEWVMYDFVHHKDYNLVLRKIIPLSVFVNIMAHVASKMRKQFQHGVTQWPSGLERTLMHQERVITALKT